MPKRKLVEVPTDLDKLSKKQLMDLVKKLDAERAGGGKKAKLGPNVDKLKKSLAKKLASEIKKCKIKTSNAKPWVEVHEGVGLEYAQNFGKDIGTQKKDTKKTWLKTLTAPEVRVLLPDIPQENFAKWTGKDLFRRKNVKTEVAFESGELKYDKSSNMMSIRVRLMNKPVDISSFLAMRNFSSSFT